MDINNKIQEFYTKYDLKHARDMRNPKDIAQQKVIVQSLFQRNITALKITMTEKKKIKYSPSTLIKVDLGQQIYCYITDNKVVSNQSIITIHGAPGSHAEWAGLQTQMAAKVRWINFIIPGFDGYDERRGNYDGTRTSLCDLIIQLIKKLQISRVTIVAHSYGTSIALHLFQQYSNYIQGFMNIGGMISFWTIGRTLMHLALIEPYQYYRQQWKNKRLYQLDEERQKIYKKYTDYFQENNFGKIGTPFLKKYQFFALFRLISYHPSISDKNLETFKSVQNLRAFVYGKNDHFHTPEKLESAIYDILEGQLSYLKKPYFQKLFAIIKRPLEEKLKNDFGIVVEGDKIQSYLLFNLKDTGHAIHRRRPVELSKIIQIYLACLEIIYKHRGLINSHM